MWVAAAELSLPSSTSGSLSSIRTQDETTCDIITSPFFCSTYSSYFKDKSDTLGGNNAHFFPSEAQLDVITGMLNFSLLSLSGRICQSGSQYWLEKERWRSKTVAIKGHILIMNLLSFLSKGDRVTHKNPSISIWVENW